MAHFRVKTSSRVSPDPQADELLKLRAELASLQRQISALEQRQLSCPTCTAHQALPREVPRGGGSQESGRDAPPLPPSPDESAQGGGQATGSGDPEPPAPSCWITGGGHGLDKSAIERYSRQLLLPSFGVQGQSRLAKAAVLVVGAGGLGAPAAMYLAAAGVGRLGIVDRDVVELNNLHRQVIHREASVGQHKSDSAASTCTALNSSVQVDVYRDGIGAQNALRLVSLYDVVLDCSDNVATRYLVNDACVLASRPLVSGAAVGLDGQLTVYNHEDGPCYRCLFPQPPPQAACQRCSDAGVLGVVPGIIGCLQALEAIKLASGVGQPLVRRMLLLDAFTSKMHTVKLRGRASDCAVCGNHPLVTPINLESVDYAAFTQSPMTDAAPARVQRVPLSHSVSVKQYKQVAASGQPHVLLDVRAPHEFHIAALPHAVNVPYDSLRQRLPDVWAAAARGRVSLGGRAAAQEEEATSRGEGAEDGVSGSVSHSTKFDAWAAAQLEDVLFKLGHMRLPHSAATGKTTTAEGHDPLAPGASAAGCSMLAAGGGVTSGVEDCASGQMDAAEGDMRSLTPVYVICRRGNDSQLAVEMLREAGINTAVDVTGGLVAWAATVDPSFPVY